LRLFALGENFEDACIERSQQTELVGNLSNLLEKGSEFEKVKKMLFKKEETKKFLYFIPPLCYDKGYAFINQCVGQSLCN